MKKLTEEQAAWLCKEVDGVSVGCDFYGHPIIGNALYKEDVKSIINKCTQNEKDIYEADIVTFEVENHSTSTFDIRPIGIMVWNPLLCCWAIKAKDRLDKFHTITINHGYDVYRGSMIVKGNIYENPQMIEAQKGV